MVSPEDHSGADEEAVPAETAKRGQGQVYVEGHASCTCRDADQPAHKGHHAAEDNDPWSMASKPMLDSIEPSFIQAQRTRLEKHRSPAPTGERVNDQCVADRAERRRRKRNRKDEVTPPDEEPG